MKATVSHESLECVAVPAEQNNCVPLLLRALGRKVVNINVRSREQEIKAARCHREKRGRRGIANHGFRECGGIAINGLRKKSGKPTVFARGLPQVDCEKLRESLNACS